MALTRLTVTEMIPFFLHVIYESIENTENPETKKELARKILQIILLGIIIN